MSRSRTWSALDERGRRRDALDVIRTGVAEFLAGLEDEVTVDPLVAPWRRSCRTAFRSASGWSSR